MSIKKLIVPVCAAAALYACFQLFREERPLWPRINAVGLLDRRMPLPAFELPIPQDRAEREYLGLSDKGTFKVGDIKSQIVIIEIFSFYCPICQVHAPLVHEVYEKIKARADLCWRR